MSAYVTWDQTIREGGQVINKTADQPVIFCGNHFVIVCVQASPMHEEWTLSLGIFLTVFEPKVLPQYHNTGIIL